MKEIIIESEMIVAATDADFGQGNGVAEWRSQMYLAHSGWKRVETRRFQSISDTSEYTEKRYSEDNGKTWGEWTRVAPSDRIRIGEDELTYTEGYGSCMNLWNPVHKHYITPARRFVFLGGYEEAEKVRWNGGADHNCHSYLEIRSEDGTKVKQQPIVYEDGAFFDEKTYRETDFLDRNCGFLANLLILKNGDILVPLSIQPAVCGRLTDTNIDKHVKSLAFHYDALIIGRGKWNEEKFEYDLTFSETILVDDRMSSRGFEEPILAELNNGNILLICRASNERVAAWNSRVSPYAPGYKFYCLSDDGGKTFSPPMPWYFDSREVVYSSTTFSCFLRSRVNGKLYWFGNIVDPTMIDGNYPRWPLQMVEVDEEWGCAKKDTLTVIDTCREGESDAVQLSNFCLLEDRETGNIELYLAKIGQFGWKNVFKSETWKYTITVPEQG